jgi:hypothetical protein
LKLSPEPIPIGDFTCTSVLRLVVTPPDPGVLVGEHLLEPRDVGPEKVMSRTRRIHKPRL